MHRLILDTNVLVSALIQKNAPYFILDHCLKKNALICLSSALLKEYLGVLSRPKFQRYRDFQENAIFLVSRLRDEALFFEPDFTISILTDEPDNRLLELARSSQADYLITGNTRDFDFSSFEETMIMSPREYWESVRTID